MHPMIQKALCGAAAGALATVPMSAVMLAWHRRLPWTKREALPPAQIVNELTRALGIRHHTTHEGRLAATVASHFGYGSAMGALYGFTAPTQYSSIAVPSGIAFGLGVWAGSYLGLLPATGLYRSATAEPAERNHMMIAAHIVCGASLGFIAHGLIQTATKSRVNRRRVSPPLARYRPHIRRALQSAQASS